MQFNALLYSFAMVLATTSVMAKETPMKLGVVDFQRALNGVEEGKKAKAKLKKELEDNQKKIDRQKATIEKLQKELQDLQKKAQSGLLKNEEIEKGRAKEAEFQKKLQAYTELVQKTQAEMAKKEGDATRSILNQLRDMVVDISRNEGYSMVLEKNESGLLYAATYTDLTEKLIQTYNKKKK